MCGRFVLDATPEDLQIHFALASRADEPHPAGTTSRRRRRSAWSRSKADRFRRGLAFLKWGLVPHWSNDSRPGPTNARAETVGGLPTFADSFRHRRCIIPATGFYEWRKVGTKKIPQQLHLAGGGVMALRGVVEVIGERGGWESTPDVLHHPRRRRTSWCDRFHDRMPAVLALDDYATWLGDTNLKDAHRLLKAAPGGSDGR